MLLSVAQDLSSPRKTARPASCGPSQSMTPVHDKLEERIGCWSRPQSRIGSPLGLVRKVNVTQGFINTYVSAPIASYRWQARQGGGQVDGSLNIGTPPTLQARIGFWSEGRTASTISILTG